MDTSWVEHEFAAVTLRDQRQRPSLLAIVERLSHHPEWSFSANCGPALRKAGWRLFSQPDVELQTAHRQASLERAGACPRVLVVQDTTDLNYHTHGKTQGLGVLGGPNIAGLSLHSALLLDAQGACPWVCSDSEFGHPPPKAALCPTTAIPWPRKKVTGGWKP